MLNIIELPASPSNIKDHHNEYNNNEKVSVIVMISQMWLLLLSHVSRVRLCETPWTAAHQAPLSMGVSRKEYWSGSPVPSPTDVTQRHKVTKCCWENGANRVGWGRVAKNCQFVRNTVSAKPNKVQSNQVSLYWTLFIQLEPPFRLRELGLDEFQGMLF